MTQKNLPTPLLSQTSSRLHFRERLPAAASFGPETLLLYDRSLARVVPGFAAWAKGFGAALSVVAGESLKDVRSFPGHIERILKKVEPFSARNLTIVVAGGGSVGDFGGFVASILKRGVSLVHIPTTWLAALDSAHGGKTALNAGGGKNQIGTFYPANHIYLVESVLRAQPPERARDAFGELAKIALIDGGAWVRRLERERNKVRDPGDIIWSHLRTAIAAKYRVVQRDPREQSGLRQILNLGHTLGHGLEIALGISHGEAVAQGTFFALSWSQRRGHLGVDSFERARVLMIETLGLKPLAEVASYRRRSPSAAVIRRLLLQDKKRSAQGKTTFVFLDDIGSPRRAEVSIDEILVEAKSQGWIR